MTAANSHDYEIRAAVVRELLRNGVPRRDIRHEITLDSNSCGGRADIAVILANRLAGIEIKSASDNLARCVEQLDAYAGAFDTPLFVVDGRLARRLERPDRQRVRESAVAVSDIWPALQQGGAATIHGMARLLWGSEIQSLVGKPLSRADGLALIGERSTLDELRRGVIAALRGRVPNKWEQAFWARFDREAALDFAA